MKKLKVLLAEDDPDDQQLFSVFLNDRNDIQLMQFAENGVELMNILNSENAELPDMIILDQNMPKMNGLQTVKALKANEHLKNIPVMFYSTFADRQLTDTCKQFGAEAVLSKPVTKEGYSKMMDSFIAAALPFLRSRNI